MLREAGATTREAAGLKDDLKSKLSTVSATCKEPGRNGATYIGLSHQIDELKANVPEGVPIS